MAGRPKKDFSDLSERQKRRRLQVEESSTESDFDSSPSKSSPIKPLSLPLGEASCRQDIFPGEAAALVDLEEDNASPTQGTNSDHSFCDSDSFSNSESEPSDSEAPCYDSDLTDCNFSSNSSFSDSSLLVEHGNPGLRDEHEINSAEDLQTGVRHWAQTFKVTNSATSSLLKMLHRHKCFSSIPTDARTLLKTPRTVNTTPMGSGSYFHCGLIENLKTILMSSVKDFPQVDLLINIDGLPLFRSSPAQFWPILCSFLIPECLNHVVFPVGIYHGKEKPPSVDEFLNEFINEVKQLENGLVIRSSLVKICIKGFILDAPAKAFTLNIKGHTGYSSCTKCCCVGEYIENRIVFPDIEDLNLRRHEDFIIQSDEEFHHGSTPLEKIKDFDFIDGIPLDYMHLVCLGVVRTLVNCWVSGKPPMKLSSHAILSVSQKLVSLRPFIPVEFARKPRSLVECKTWKATEYRQLLLYTGCVVLKDFLNEDFYALFLTLQVAITILLKPSCREENINYAQTLLKHFVMAVKTLFGKKMLSHNFHGLLHLADAVFSYGSLDNCSSFRFENFLQSLKKKVRKGAKPLEQIAKRLGEMGFSGIPHPSTESNHQDTPKFSMVHSAGPLIEGLTDPQYKKLHFRNITLTSGKGNACFCSTDGKIVVIKNFATRSSDGQVVALGHEFNEKENFFDQPCHSSLIELYKVNGFSLLKIFELSEIGKKHVLLPYKYYYVTMPLIHCAE